MDSILSAVPASKNINQIILDTINETEKILLSLPKDGDHVEIITSPSNGKKNTIAKKKKNKYKQFCAGMNGNIAKCTSPIRDILPSLMNASFSDNSEYSPEIAPIRQTMHTGNAKIVPGSVHISALSAMIGIIIELKVNVCISKSGETRTIDLHIDCPDFVPRRIRIDGKWHEII